MIIETHEPCGSVDKQCYTRGVLYVLVDSHHGGGYELTSFSCVFSECYTANGEDYRGFQNQTSLHGGKPCLFWNETFQHPYNTLKYPNGEGGLGSHNYCR